MWIHSFFFVPINYTTTLVCPVRHLTSALWSEASSGNSFFLTLNVSKRSGIYLQKLLCKTSILCWTCENPVTYSTWVLWTVDQVYLLKQRASLYSAGQQRIIYSTWRRSSGLIGSHMAILKTIILKTVCNLNCNRYVKKTTLYPSCQVFKINLGYLCIPAGEALDSCSLW